MWLVALIVTLAGASEPEAQATSASPGAMAAVSSADWTLSSRAWRVDATATIAQRTGQLDLRSGYVFRVEDADGPVGAVFIGDGDWTVHFEAPRQARRFANRRVLAEGDDPAALIDIAWGEPWTTTVDRGALYGVDVWRSLQPSLLEVKTRGAALLTAGDTSVEELLVVEDVSLSAARILAAEVLTHRTKLARTHGSDPAAHVALDRLEGCRLNGGAEACSRHVELRTTATWDRYAGVQILGAGGRWLHWVRDPRGLLDPRLEEQVLALAVDSFGEPFRREIAVAPFPVDAFGVPTAPHRVDLHEARVSHEVSVAGGVLVQESTAYLTVRPAGGDARVVVVDVPHVEQQPFLDLNPLPNGFSLHGVELSDGTPLRSTVVGFQGDQRDGRGTARTLLVELPDALGDGELQTLRVRYRDHHRYGHHLNVEAAIGPQVMSLGAGVDFQAVPTVRGHGGFPYPAVVRVGQSHARHQVAIAGSDPRVWEEGDLRWTEAVTQHGEAGRVAVGRWSMGQEHGGAAAPTVTTGLQPHHGPFSPEISSLVRQAFAFHESLLHPIDARGFTVAELGSTGALVPDAAFGEGLVTIRPGFQETRGRALLLPSALSVVAGVHRQWWLPTGAHGVDPTLPEQMGAGYALAFMTRTARPVDVQELSDVAREIVKQGRFTALSRARVEPWTPRRQVFATRLGRVPVTAMGQALPNADLDWPIDRGGVPWLGAFVIGRSLLAEVGDEAFFQGVHHVVLGNAPPTWDGLQFALEQTSGRDLSDWFDTWVHGDHAPSVDVRWVPGDGELRLEVTSDLPFGGFTVPVQVDGTVHRVEIVDGWGELVVPATSRRPRVRVDPEGTLLLSKARVSRG